MEKLCTGEVLQEFNNRSMAAVISSPPIQHNWPWIRKDLFRSPNRSRSFYVSD